jgi:hypothetical protein
MLDKVKNLLNNYLLLLDKKSRVLYLLIRSIQCAEIDQITKIRLQEELKHNF